VQTIRWSRVAERRIETVQSRLWCDVRVPAPQQFNQVLA
jgi:hypothetical protein